MRMAVQRKRFRAPLFAAISAASLSACLSLETPDGGLALLAIVSGNEQTVQTNAAAASPFTVRAFGNDAQSLRDVAINWSIASGGGTLSSSQTVTDDSGHAAVSYTAGNTPGTVTVRATAEQLTVTFTVTVIAPPA